ncbi:MAG: FAD-dependent 5-carboxymethylaminomethyl-2-thiouridine(34) oxidoreductase MnmC [Pseudobdellovibrionaceae bacterium]
MDVPVSKEFDDIYFSRDDGLAESRFVFLEGNGFPAAFKGKEHLVIAETGFGTGLNYLTLRALLEKHAPDLPLHFISFEKYPLSKDEIAASLAHWKDEFPNAFDELLVHYPLRIPCIHDLRLSEKHRLTLVFGDINDTLPQIGHVAVDAWFLDGFNPAKNPAMWSQTVFENMARLSAPHATFATFTAAGFVKRGLREVGFDVQKTEGFGRKRERLVGTFQGEGADIPTSPFQGKRVAIIGGGIAGCAAAYEAQIAGAKVTLFEAGDTLAGGASGNPRGMINPRFSKLKSDEADFYMEGFARTIKLARQIAKDNDIDYAETGALHLITNTDKEERFKGTCSNWGWHTDHMELVNADEASQIAGIPLEHGALYLPQSASLHPPAFCAALAKGAEIRLLAPVKNIVKAANGWSVDGEAFDIVILAGGPETSALSPVVLPETHTVRGQLSYIEVNETSLPLKCNLHYGGYISVARDGMHVVGSTFQRWLVGTEVREEDHKYIINNLEEAVPALKNVKIVGGRAALRTSAKSRFPLFGALDGGLYVSTAHGSHGLVSASVAARRMINPLEQEKRLMVKG